MGLTKAILNMLFQIKILPSLGILLRRHLDITGKNWSIITCSTPDDHICRNSKSKS